MLKYTKTASVVPDLVRAIALVTDSDRIRAAKEPPQVVPFHCKPWLDGQLFGWTVNWWQSDVASIKYSQELGLNMDWGSAALKAKIPFLPRENSDYFLVDSGYQLMTEPGYSTLTISANRLLPGLQLLSSTINTDQALTDLILKIKLPEAGQTLVIKRGDELARIIVVSRERNRRIEPMNEKDFRDLAQLERKCAEEERVTPTRWISAEGYEFTHLYKEWSRHHRRDRK